MYLAVTIQDSQFSQAFTFHTLTIPTQDAVEGSYTGASGRALLRPAVRDDAFSMFAARNRQDRPVSQPRLDASATSPPNRGWQLLQRHHGPSNARLADCFYLYELHLLGRLLQLLDRGTLLPRPQRQLHARAPVHPGRYKRQRGYTCVRNFRSHSHSSCFVLGV